MSSKNKVSVKVSNADNFKGNFSGGDIGNSNSAEDTSNEVIAELQDIKNSKIQVSGGSISEDTQSLEPLLKELIEILIPLLPEKSQRQDLQDIADEVLIQATKPAEEKNIPKIQRLLNSLSGYIGITAFALTQVEKTKALFEGIQKLILGH
jgi:hypothetical protein